MKTRILALPLVIVVLALAFLGVLSSAFGAETPISLTHEDLTEEKISTALKKAQVTYPETPAGRVAYSAKNLITDSQFTFVGGSVVKKLADPKAIVNLKWIYGGDEIDVTTVFNGYSGRLINITVYPKPGHGVGNTFFVPPPKEFRSTSDHWPYIFIEESMFAPRIIEIIERMPAELIGPVIKLNRKLLEHGFTLAGILGEVVRFPTFENVDHGLELAVMYPWGKTAISSIIIKGPGDPQFRLDNTDKSWGVFNKARTSLIDHIPDLYRSVTLQNYKGRNIEPKISRKDLIDAVEQPIFILPKRGVFVLQRLGKSKFQTVFTLDQGRVIAVGKSEVIFDPSGTPTVIYPGDLQNLFGVGEVDLEKIEKIHTEDDPYAYLPRRWVKPFFQNAISEKKVVHVVLGNYLLELTPTQVRLKERGTGKKEEWKDITNVLP